jgi:hypothetical protein
LHLLNTPPICPLNRVLIPTITKFQQSSHPYYCPRNARAIWWGPERKLICPFPSSLSLSLSLSLLHTANWGKQYSTDQPLVGLEIQQTRLEILVTTQEMPFTLAVSTRGVPSTLGAPVILIIIIIINNARIYQCTRRCTVPLTS